MFDAYRVRFATQQHGRPVRPPRRCLLTTYPRAFSRNPLKVSRHERRRFGARAPTRDGDTQRSIRPHAQNVSPRFTKANELNPVRGFSRLVGWRSEKERKIELHARLQNDSSRAAPSFATQRED